MLAISLFWRVHIFLNSLLDFIEIVLSKQLLEFPWHILILAYNLYGVSIMQYPDPSEAPHLIFVVSLSKPMTIINLIGRSILKTINKEL